MPNIRMGTNLLLGPSGLTAIFHFSPLYISLHVGQENGLYISFRDWAIKPWGRWKSFCGICGEDGDVCPEHGTEKISRM
jgi:hypothetical protein